MDYPFNYFRNHFMKKNTMKSPFTDINPLLQIMDNLRENCPWDRVQTIETLRQQTIEELYELTDALSIKNWNAIREELGDLLLHIVFYAKNASENQAFTMEEVIKSLCDKLINRHSHIYSRLTVHDINEIERNWQEIKIREGKRSAFAGIPASLPPLLKALRIQEKAKNIFLQKENKEQVLSKILGEINHLNSISDENDTYQKEESFGEILFTLINYARILTIDPDRALESKNLKYINTVKANGKETQGKAT